MNDKGKPKEFIHALNTIARFADLDHPIRQEAVKLLQESEHGGDVTKHMRNVKFQCLKCKEVFETEKQYRVHAGMSKFCGGISPEDSDYDSIDEQMNIVRPGP